MVTGSILHRRWAVGNACLPITRPYSRVQSCRSEEVREGTVIEEGGGNRAEHPLNLITGAKDDICDKTAGEKLVEIVDGVI